MRRGHRRGGVAVLLGALALAAAGSDYRGCAPTGTPPAVPADGVEIPAGTGCLVDGDCAALDECVAMGCRLGECVPLGPGIDNDGDGYSPMPCGGDCDDADAARHPEAGELCDGVDQDCDGAIDEGATGAETLRVDDGTTHAILVAAGDRFVVVGRAADALAAYVIDAGGGAGPSTIVFDGGFGAFAALGRDDGTIGALVAPSDGSPPFVQELAREGLTLEVVGAPRELGVVGGVTGFAAIHFAAQDWIAFDTGTLADPRRWLARGDEAPAELAPNVDGVAPALAHDGTRVAVAEGRATLRFMTADGSDAGTIELPGPFAAQPLAPGDGFVYAAYRDAFDHALTRATPTSTTSPIAAPRGERTDSVGIFRLAEHVLVTRVSSSDARAWLLEDDLSTYVVAFSPGQVSPVLSAPRAVSAATSTSGLSAIHTSHDGVSGLALLVCGGL